MLWCSKKVSACLQYRDFSMRVWMWFCQFLKKVSIIIRCLLYSMSATDRFDCILVLLVNKMDVNYIFPTWFFITAEWHYFMIKKTLSLNFIIISVSLHHYVSTKLFIEHLTVQTSAQSVPRSLYGRDFYNERVTLFHFKLLFLFLWPNILRSYITLARWFWVIKVYLWVSKISKICQLGCPAGQVTFSHRLTS